MSYNENNNIRTCKKCYSNIIKCNICKSKICENNHLYKTSKDILPCYEHISINRKIKIKDLNNDELLDNTKNLHIKTTEKLKSGLQIIESTKLQSSEIAITIENNKEKISNTSRNIDQIDSELVISKKILARFLKNIYTNKIILSFVLLLIIGFIIAIFVYLKKSNKI